MMRPMTPKTIPMVVLPIDWDEVSPSQVSNAGGPPDSGAPAGSCDTASHLVRCACGAEGARHLRGWGDDVKFVRAPLPGNTLRRPRLVEALASADVPLTLVVAGPGCGKTVAVGHWLEAEASDGRMGGARPW